MTNYLKYKLTVSPMKRHKVAEWIFFFFFQKKCLYAVYNRLTSEVRTHGLEVKEWKRIFHADENQKLAGVAIHISDKIDFQAKTGIRDKEVII